MAQIHILQKTDGPESQPTDPSNKASGGRCRFFQRTINFNKNYIWLKIQ